MGAVDNRRESTDAHASPLTPLQVKIAFHPQLRERRPTRQRTYFGAADAPSNWVSRQEKTRQQFLASSTTTDVPKELQDYHTTGGFGYPLAVRSAVASGAAGIGLPSQDTVYSCNRWVEGVSAGPGNPAVFLNLILGDTPAQRYTIRQRPDKSQADIEDVVRVMVDGIVSWGNANLPNATDGTNCTVTQGRIPYAQVWGLILVGRGDKLFDHSRLFGPLDNPISPRRSGFARLNPPDVNGFLLPQQNYLLYFRTIPSAGWQSNQAIPFFFNRLFLDLPYNTNPVLQVL